MREQRIKLRFHRFGIRVAAVLAAPSALSLAASLPAYCGLYTGVSLSDVSEPLALMLALIGAVGLGLAVGCYAGALALGWVISRTCVYR
jgi:hypothetical protein